MSEHTPDPHGKEVFQSAVEHRLSGLTGDPWLARKIILQEQGEKKVKKRRTAGLLIALSLVLVLSVALAENRDRIMAFLSTVGSAPEQVTGRNDDLDKLDPVEIIHRTAVERLYAPVELYFLQEGPYSLNVQVAQVMYDYRLTHHIDTGAWEVDPQPPVLSAVPFGADALSPFSPWLYADGSIQDVSYTFDSIDSSGEYRIHFDSPCSLTYYRTITLDESGAIVDKTASTVDRVLSLTDQNGALSANCYFVSSPPGPGPTPTPLPVTAAQVTRETEASQLVYGDTPGEKYYYRLYFGAPYTVHYQDQTGEEMTHRADDCRNMLAYFNWEQFENLPEFGKQDGPVETAYDLIFLGGANSNALVTIDEIEKPVLTAFYMRDFYTVRVTGGKFRVQYPTDVYYGPEAYQQKEEGVWQFIPDRRYVTRVEYAVEECPYAFTFRLQNPKDYQTTVSFGQDFPRITQHMIQTDNTEKVWEWPQFLPLFEANIQVQTVTPLVDFSAKSQTLDYQPDFISFKSSAGLLDPLFTVVEKPVFEVTPDYNGYAVTVTGGLLRISYETELWRQEQKDGSVLALIPPESDRCQVEIPFDFTFSVPVYASLTDPVYDDIFDRNDS